MSLAPGTVPSGPTRTSETGNPHTVLERAAATLGSTASPLGRSLTCAVGPNVLAARCAVPATSLSSVIPPLGFLPSTGGPLAPPASTAATLAWDAPVHEAVLFGGTGTTGAMNSTWTFNGTWINITNPADAPPARYGAAMDFDNQSQEIVLFGGCGIHQCPLADTWTFQAGVWVNDTGELGSATPVGAYDASLVDYGNQGALLFGGCIAPSCTSQTNSTEVFATSASCPAPIQPGPCWTAWTGPAGSGPSARAGTALGYFPPENLIVLYGGYSGAGPGRWYDLNDTWVFHGDSWKNTTIDLTQTPGIAYPSTGRSYASFFYYGAPAPFAGQLYLYGGFNHTTGASYPQVWGVVGLGNVTEGWENFSDSISQPAARERPAMASTYLSGPSENYAAILVGGESRDSDLFNDTWVFENQTLLNPSVSPIPSETNQTLQFQANATGGTQPLTARWNFGDGRSGVGVETDHSYALGGNYTATVTTTDAWGVRNSSSVSVAVRLPSINLTLPSAIDTNLTAEFSASLLNGTPLNGTPNKYNISWSFPGHRLTPGAQVAVIFPSPGVKECSVEIEDGTGTEVARSFAVTVNPVLIATPAFSPSNPKPGATVNFTVTASGGTSPYTYSWEFGSGKSSNRSSPTNVFSKSGTYIIQVWTNDSIGASTERNLTVTVGTTSPPFVFDLSRGIWVIVAIAIIVAVVVLLAILGRRRPPNATETSPTTPVSVVRTPPWDETLPPPAPGGPVGR